MEVRASQAVFSGRSPIPGDLPMSSSGKADPMNAPHACPVQTILDELGVRTDEGLTEEEVQERREAHGRNKLREVEQEGAVAILLRQFRSLIMLVLALASGLSLAFGRWIDALAILVAMLINAAIGFFTELKAFRSMEALQKMDQKFATVIRNAGQKDVEAEALVPGDLVLLEGGDVVTADMRVLEANNLQVDESALTGESTPVSKGPDPAEADTPLAERRSMLYKGTAVTQGSGKGVVVTTGMETELGGVTSLVQSAEGEEDPLTQRLDQLASRLVKGIMVVAGVTGVAGLLAGKELYFMVETAIALFVAAVPEGLPIVATLALARGMQRMARRNALVRRLSAVQTLGSTNIILTDKTGTLTENRMTLTTARLPGLDMRVEGTGLSTEGTFKNQEGEPVPTDHPVLNEALKVAVLCNNASLSGQEAVGDPTEVALLVWGAKGDVHRDALLEEMEEVREVSFDPDTKMMATLHRVGAEGDQRALLAAVKGAPHAVLEVSQEVLGEEGPEEMTEEDRHFWEEENRRLAGEGLRVLALAHGHPSDPQGEVYEGLTFLGLVGLLDPVRDEVRAPLDTCRSAGIRVVMVTGDQQETATAVARELDLLPEEGSAFPRRKMEEAQTLEGEDRKAILEESVFFRVTPEQKLDLIALHQDAGSIVGMIGDGVNDAPALKKADIGIAMGDRGEPVAEDAADIILQDDRFATVAVAVREGRIIFKNIRSFVVYMISGNIGEILLVFLAVLAGAPLPLLPLQILYINAVNDIFPALALGVGPGSGREMSRPPRDPEEPLMTRREWTNIGIFGAVVGLPILAGFLLALNVWNTTTQEAVTVSFLSVAFARLWHAFNMRETDSGLFRNQVTANPWVWGALGLCVVLLMLAVYVPPLAQVLDVVSPSLRQWGIILGTSLIPLALGQLLRVLRWV